MRGCWIVGTRLRRPALVCALAALATPAGFAAVWAGASSARTPPAPVITSVVFRGSPTKPLVVIRGQNFGTRPPADPTRGVSNFGFCGPIAAPAGFDFGSALWLEDETQRWSGGYSPYVDCIGLILVIYKPTEIAYKFGSWYHVHFKTRNRFPHGVYGLFSGDVVNIKVRGVNVTATVRYHRLTRPVSRTH